MKKLNDHFLKQKLSTGFIPILILLISFATDPAMGQVSGSLALTKQDRSFSDSLLKSFDLQELVEFRQFYNNEVKALKKRSDIIRDNEIVVGNRLFDINPDSPFMDKVLARLAEFSYRRAEDIYFKEMERYEEEFVRFENGEIAQPPDEPKPDYSASIKAYDLIIRDFPESELTEEALYQLAFTLERNFEGDRALALYERVANEFPESRYAPEALIRLGEYHFDPFHRNIDLAIEFYSRAMKYKDTPRYDEALYKLGWSYYSIEQHADAIHAFTTLVEDIEKYEDVDHDATYTNASLKKEALEYIGVCFRDFGGLPSALAYIDSIGRPEYGETILTKMGDIYRENEEKQGNAILAYMATLERYPLSVNAPEIQEKIIQSSVLLEDFKEVYLAQKKLFDTYKPDGEWQKQIRQDGLDPYHTLMVLRSSTEKAELAQRENINLLIKLGEEKEDLSYFNLAVKESQKYLQAFPFDTSAYTVHWNIALIYDSKLNQKEKAYRAYLDVCNNYLQDEFRRTAAENAIVLARESLPNDSLILANADSTTQIDVLDSAEVRLVEAYDNFILHYPNDEITAEVLGNVGSIYYNSKKYDLALRYFNTLSGRFPDNPYASKAQFSALESYFGKKDYGSAESMAKKMQDIEDLPPELRTKVSRRLAESIYLNAEALAGSGDHLQAAKRFREVYDQVPDAEFADKSIFQAGVQFDLAKDFSQAIIAYSDLIQNFPETEHYLDAVNNLALDYGEIGEYQQAAGTYEKLASIHTDSSKAQDALYNSSHFYTQSKSWQDAIRVNRAYVTRFPQASDSEDMYYNMAEFYLKLDNFDQANVIYGEFASRFPDSPRSVETHYKRGKYFLEKYRVSEALGEFSQAVARNSILKQQNRESNDFYAAEALFAKTEHEFKQYLDIRFSQSNLAGAQENKRSNLKQLEKQYTDVAAYGTIRLYESTYRIGQLYEEFANSWSQQDVPPMSQTEKIMHMKKLNQESAKLYDRAFDSYKSGFLALQRLADAYQPEPVQDTSVNYQRVVEEDSTLRVANNWVARSGEKVSEMLFNVAELKYGSANDLLKAPIPGGMDAVTELEYRNQVLAKAVFPVVQQVTGDYIRSLREADSLQLENEWVAKSRTRLFDVMSVISLEYKQLCLDAYDTYSQKYNQYVSIMTQGTDEEQENSLDLAGSLVNIIELSNNYATSMEKAYKLSIDQVASQPFGQSIAHSLISELITTSVELSDNFQKSASEAGHRKDEFTLLNQKTPRMAYEDAIFTFSDLETYFKDNAIQLSENTYGMTKDYAFSVPESVLLEGQLVRLDPQRYASEFQVPVDKLKLSPDESWLYTSEVSDSTWHLPDYGSSGWLPAVAYSDLSGNSDPILLYDRTDSTSVDSSVAVSNYGGTPKVYYLRREIDLEHSPLSASLKLNADDNVKVYVNGVMVFEEQDENLGWGNKFETDLTQLLKPGKNLVAIELDDSDGSGHGIQPVLELEEVDYAALSEREAAIEEEKPTEIATTDEMIFIRNYVPQ